jgi:hypothetical protein
MIKTASHLYIIQIEDIEEDHLYYVKRMYDTNVKLQYLKLTYITYLCQSHQQQAIPQTRLYE